MFFEEDLKRRDFTINALVLTKTVVIDLSKAWMTWKIGFCGLLGRLLERFNEDALASCGAFVLKAPLNFD